jgi:hypothetical protein
VVASSGSFAVSVTSCAWWASSVAWLSAFFAFASFFLDQVLVSGVGFSRLQRREPLAALAAAPQLTWACFSHYMIHLFRPLGAVGMLRHISRRLLSL